MKSKLDQLRDITTVVADTGDIEAVARLKPVDCTTNPSIVLKALGTPMFAEAVKEGVARGRKQGGSPEAVSAAVADRLAISVGAALVELVRAECRRKSTPTCPSIPKHRLPRHG